MSLSAKLRAEQLSCWEGSVTAIPLTGGLTNTNFTVHYQEKDYVVRIGEDIPIHGVMRFNEQNASVAAFKAGISPEIIHIQEDALVMRFIKGRTLNAADLQNQSMLERALPLLKRCHNDVPNYLKAGSLSFWVFQVNRNYAGSLNETQSLYKKQLVRLMQINIELEKAVGRVTMAFCHNDMLAANFIDTPNKLWLIDWDYAGFNSPLFDLSNLATNNGLSYQQEIWLLENYFETPINNKLWRSYCAMKCASQLRESMWSMVSEEYSNLDFDYREYTQDNLERFQQAYREFTALAEK
ncbi:MAG: thiamine kinase-like enzyme [Oceanospirillaceae bacterium]|jgi:thiamine kinase-like enzyme